MDSQKNAEKRRKFVCESCDFTCSKQSDFDRHLSTGKHKMITNNDEKTPKNAKSYLCECGKSYKYRQGLYKHQQKCTYIEAEDEKDEKEEKKEEGPDYKE